MILTKNNKEIIFILKNFKICWICEGKGLLPDSEELYPKLPYNLINCFNCQGSGYEKRTKRDH